MKRTFSRLALSALLTAGAASAAPFTGQGIPADAGAILHLDGDAARNSVLLTPLQEIFEQASAGSYTADRKKATEALNAEFGFTKESLHDATVVYYFTPGYTSDKIPDFAVHIHGKFDSAKILSVLTKKNPEVKLNKLGSHTWFSIADWSRLYREKSLADMNKKTASFCICPVNDGTILVASDTGILARHLKAIDSGEVYPDKAVSAAFAGSPVVAGYVTESLLNALEAAKPKKPGAPAGPEAKNSAFTLTETGGNVAIHSVTQFTDEKGAKQINGQAAMFLGFGQMMLSQQKPDATEKQKADQALALEVLQALKLSATGDTFVADLTYPTEKLAAKLRENKDAIVAAFVKQRKTLLTKPAAAPATEPVASTPVAVK